MAIINLNDSNFEAEVLQAQEGVLVDFFANWCGPCKMLAPVLEAFDAETQGKYKICKVDIDQASAAASNMGVMVVPTLIFFKKGEAVYRSEGFMDGGELKDLAEKYL